MWKNLGLSQVAFFVTPLLLVAVASAADTNTMSRAEQLDTADYWFESIDWELRPSVVRTLDRIESETELELAQLTSPRTQGLRARRPTGSGLTSPRRQPSARIAQANQPRRRSALSTATAIGLASIPYMIGDTGAGTCFSLRGVLFADIAHPTLTCSRLNISENNSTLPVDRIYYGYRHFHNATDVRVFQFNENFDVNRHTIGMERTFWNGNGSLELRIPIEQRLNSELGSIIAPGFGVVDAVVAFPETRVELANISAVLKLLLLDCESFALSAGLGVTVPTATDVDYQIVVSDQIQITPVPGLVGLTVANVDTTFENETVYLAPFLSWITAPQSRWFHHGFLQVEVAANPSTLHFLSDGVVDFFRGGANVGTVVFFSPAGTTADVFAQTLLRLNLGVGYRMVDAPHRKYLKAVTALFEMHYTGTLQDANVSGVPLQQIGAGEFVPQSATVGNADRRADILNVVAGVSAQIGRVRVTNGFGAPIRTGTDRGFDFEYNFHVQRSF